MMKRPPQPQQELAHHSKQHRKLLKKAASYPSLCKAAGEEKASATATVSRGLAPHRVQERPAPCAARGARPAMRREPL